MVTLLMSSVVTRQADLALSESATRQAANQRIIVEEHDRQMEALQVTTDWLPLTSHPSPCARLSRVGSGPRQAASAGLTYARRHGRWSSTRSRLTTPTRWGRCARRTRSC